MTLCKPCSLITLDALTRHIGPDVAQRLGVQKGMIFLENGSFLSQSALKCPVCALIQETLLRNFHGPQYTGSSSQVSGFNLSSDAIYLEPKSDTIGSTFPEEPTTGSYLTAFNVIAIEASTRKKVEGKVRLFTEWPNQSVANRHQIVGRPQFEDPTCDTAFLLMRNWVHSCKNGHQTCSETLSGAILDESVPPILPSRVLDIKATRVRLFESHGQHGKYVTLSHCWGPANKRPVRTTKANLQEHLEHIPWPSITKNCQDAITVARGMGFEYIWIDSLCIVQDDQDDWLRESSQMGSIYERAELTLAASHTSNSIEGFLHPRPPRAASVELPNFLSSSTATDHPKVYATVRRDSATDTFPEFGALNYRAWATQEWLLSRRMIFFTKGILIWSCKAITQRETGEKFYSVSRNPRWKNIVEQYSERQLTFATDKLIALEGLRTEMGRKSNYAYAFGVWKESLPDQLLWQVTNRVACDAMHDALGLPTWTWTHIPCSVKFLSISGAKNRCEAIEFSEDSREVTIRSRLRPISMIIATLDSDPDAPITKAISSDLNSSNAKRTSTMAKYILDQDGSVIGWTVFDSEAGEADLGSVYCVVLMGSVGRREEEAERRIGKTISKKLRHYWILVARQQSDGKFRRIGVGKTYGREWWQDAPFRAITLT